MNKKVLKLLFSFFVVFSLVFTFDVDAAKFHRGNKYVSTVSVGLPGGSRTLYNKKVDNSIAYCPEFGRSAPAEGATVTSFGSIYSRDNLVSGQIVTIGRSQYSGEKEYVYISQALNCYYKYNKSFLKGCNNTINNIVNTAVNNVNSYKFNSNSSTSSLPKISIKSSSATMTKTTTSTDNNATFVSGVIEVSGLESSNYGGNNTKYKFTSTKPEYKVTLGSSAGGVKLCKNAEGTDGCINNGDVITENGNYYLIVNNGGKNGGSANLKINGSNSSNYPSVKRWEKGSYQRLITYTEKVVINRSVSASADFRFSPIDGTYSASIMKTDDSGEVLTGAKLRLFTAADSEGKTDTVTLCTISPSDVNGSCSKSGILADDNNKYSTGRFICYSEETTPGGYVNVSTHCDPINLGNSSYYYRSESNSNNEISITQELYDEAHLYEQGTNLKYQFHVGTGTSASDYIYDTSDTLYKYEFSDGRGVQYKQSDADYKHVDSQGGNETDVITSWYDINPETGEHINILVTPITSDKQVCQNDNGVTDKTEYCNGKYQFHKVSFTSGNVTINVGNALNYVSVSKKAIAGDSEVPGATLSIFKAGSDGKCSNELAKAKRFIYTPFEVPEGSGTSGGEDSDSQGGNDNSSDGANGEIDDQEIDEGTDSGIDIASNGLRWVSSDTPVTIYGLDAGNYCLQEELPPSGYKLNPTTVKFTMTDTGDITNVSKDLYDEENKTLILNDEYTKVSISKADIATTKEIPGAELKICSAVKNVKGEYEPISTETGEVGDCDPDLLADGTEALWISGTEPHDIIGLAAGTYYLIETTAPDGYVKAESILFVLTNEGKLTDINGNSLENNKITMYDDYAHVPPTLSNISLIVIVAGVILVSAGVGGYFWINKKRNSQL